MTTSEHASSSTYIAVYIPSPTAAEAGTVTPQKKNARAINSPVDSPRLDSHNTSTDVVPSIGVDDSQLPGVDNRIFNTHIEAIQCARQFKAVQPRLKKFDCLDDALVFARTGSPSTPNMALMPAPSSTPRLQPQRRPRRPSDVTEEPMSNSPAAEEPACPFPSVTTRQMTVLKKAIENTTTGYEQFEQLVMSNPRYLIGDSGHTPAIVHSGERRRRVRARHAQACDITRCTVHACTAMCVLCSFC
jgi:hypothetical protein